MAEQTIAEKSEQWPEITAQMLDGFMKRLGELDFVKGGEAVIIETLGTVVGILMRMASPIGLGLAKSMASAENVLAPAFSDFAAAGVNDIFGTNISASAFASSRGGGGRGGAGDALGRALMDILRGDASQLTPSDAAAAKFVGAISQIALEDWFKGWFFEILSSTIPQLDIGKIEAYGALGDKVSNVLGLNRIAGRALRPIVDATITTPLEWHTNKTYRPRLLSASEAARQVARGRWTREQGIEELARQGYSSDRIELLLTAAEKFFSPSDVRTFVGRGHWTRDQGIAHLKDQGYTETAALDALRLEGLRTFEQLETSEANAIIGAYADRRIDRAQFGGLLSDLVQVDSERALFTEKGELLRSLSVRRLSLSQVEAMVKSKVLSVIDYRNAARREGYPEEDVLALELQLRYEMDRAADMADARTQALAERAKEQADRAAAAAARKAQLEDERAAARRGPLSKLERAAVRGLIPIARVQEVYARDYDPDTVQLLSELLDDERADYLERQQRAEDARKRSEARGLSIGEQRAAVRAGHLTLAEFRERLGALGLDAGDAEILTATLATQLAEEDAAKRLRDEARGAAGKRSIDLGRFEQLVRRGARTLPQYDALLADLGFDEPDRAAMVDLLQLQIADDAAARAKREAAAAQLDARGLSLDQFERAVVLGVKTVDQYAAFLLEQDFTADAQVALIALLRNRVDEANAARARREATREATGRRQLALSTVRRAAQLGVVSPTVYAARLAAAGYSDDDIALDVDLLLAEIADAQARRQRREQLERDAQTRNVSLAQVEQAVKRGLAPIDEYRARAASAGYSGEDLELLVSLLVDELQQQRDARDRREEIARELAGRALNLGQLEEAVKKGFTSLDDFFVEVTALGYGADDAELLTALLAADLVAAASTSEG